ncbi:MAG: NADH-quinone oxidoreductase subunit C [Candidatus Thorarchaeota archaeon]
MIDEKVPQEEVSNRKTELPLLFKNFKKTFGENVKGPVGNESNEYKVTFKAGFLLDAVKFLYLRGITHLAAIHYWETENNINFAYHFIAKIGKEHLDSKITLIVYLPKVKKSIKSISKYYANAGFFENEIHQKFEVEFEK